MDERHQRETPITIFYSYAHEDEKLRERLEKHLSLLRQQGVITEWYDRQIVAGTDWTQAIDNHLKTASIILLLISPDFLASDYCYSIEMKPFSMLREVFVQSSKICIALLALSTLRSPHQRG